MSRSPAIDDMPHLQRKVLRALRSKENLPIPLTAKEADFLIAEGGGPDPDVSWPQQMFLYRGRAVVVRSSPTPICWRL